MHVAFTQKTLKDWAGYRAFREGSDLFEKGRVESVAYDPPFVTGMLSIGVQGMRSKFEVLENGLVENLCPCRESREAGRVCPHLVALGLEAVRLYSDPYREYAMAGERRRAARLAAFDASAYHTRDPNGAPAALRLILKHNWRDELANGSVSMRCAVELDGKMVPLNEVPKAQPIAIDSIDDELLSLIEDVCAGPAKARFTVSLFVLVSILELCGEKPIYEGGVDGYLLVDDSITTPSVHMDLDEETGELALRLRAEGSDDFTCVVSGGHGWILQDGVFSKLGSVLPGVLSKIYDGAVRIPRASIPSFMKNEFPMLTRLAEVDTSVTPDMLSLRPATPRFRLEIKGTPASLSATLHAEYGIVQLVAGRAEALGRFTVPAEDGFLNFEVRNQEAEQHALRRVNELGFHGSQGDSLIPLRNNRDILNFLGVGMTKLQRMGWSIELTGTVAAFMDNVETIVPAISISSSASAGFFEVDYDYNTAEGSSLDPVDIQQAIEMGESFVEKNGRTILLDVDAIETAHAVFNDCSAGSDSTAGTVKINDIHAGYVQSSLLSLSGVDVKTSQEWMTKAEAQNRDAKVEPVPLGDALESTLRAYQKDGVYWLRFLERSGFCGILADEMGLGKTLQALAWLQLQREREGAQHAPALGVCPTSLVDNWSEETERFTPGQRVLRMHGAGRHKNWDRVAESDLVITSYALIRRDLDEYLQHTFSVVILDEAQHIKNRTTQNATAVKKIEAHHKLVLTGTPIENSVADIWSIMDFLMPGYLGTHRTFRDHYELPIRHGGPDAEVAQSRLRRKLHPFLLRRLKKEVARDLPEKIQRVAHSSLSGDQAKVYKQLIESAKKEITSLVDSQGFNKSRMQVLKLLLQLRQACCHLDLLKLPGLKSEFPSAKMELLFELVDEALDAGHRILVFSQFTSMLAIIRSELEARQLEYCYLDGSTRDRQERVHRFNSDRTIPLFLISLKAGGSGLNLTGADMVIHFDPWWNPAVEDQATDRAHRIGQRNTVYSVKLITKGTIEEKVLQMQQKKQSVIDAALEKDGELGATLSWHDVQDLLSF